MHAVKAIRNRVAKAQTAPGRPSAVFKATGSPAISGRRGAPAAPRPAEDRAPDRARDLVAGPATGFPAALWRELGGRFLTARDLIKQTSIEQERRHGDDAGAHDAGVIATAQTVDAILLGNTATATVNSAHLAGAKYRQNRVAKTPETERSATVAAYRERHRTFGREAARARDKGLRVRLAGNDVAAREYELDAERYREAARATLDDARKAGVDPQRVAGEDAGPDGSSRIAGTPDPHNRAAAGRDTAGAEENPTVDRAANPAGEDKAGTTDRRDIDESARRQESIERHRAEKTAELKRRLQVRDPQALVAAVGDVRTALKRAGNDPAARKAALEAFGSRLKTIGAGIPAREALMPVVRDPGFVSGTAGAGDIVFQALTGSTPEAAGRRELRERRSRALEAERQATAEAAKNASRRNAPRRRNGSRPLPPR